MFGERHGKRNVCAQSMVHTPPVFCAFYVGGDRTIWLRTLDIEDSRPFTGDPPLIRLHPTRCGERMFLRLNVQHLMTTVQYVQSVTKKDNNIKKWGEFGNTGWHLKDAHRVFHTSIRWSSPFL